MHAAMADDLLWQLDSVSLEPARLLDVSVKIPRGVTAVLGWSGAGKTSLLNVLAEFEKPDRGALHGAPRAAWAPQDHGLWPHCTAREHLAIVRGSRDGIEPLLAAFDLDAKAGARPGALSQGERSRLAVARALATDADVLVLDEPLAHVDPARSGKYWRVIRESVARAGTSLVFSTHQPDTVLAQAKRVVCLGMGRVLHAGDTCEIYENPPTAELMECLGPGNWLTPDEARRYLKIETDAPRCFRPEQIEIVPGDAGEFAVNTASFRGAVEEVEIAGRAFFHRPPMARLRAGARVSVRLRS
jgi:ABC-type sulfate/molybdate transport systems ATPase subunit